MNQIYYHNNEFKALVGMPDKPEAPPVMISIYADQMAMNRYTKELKVWEDECESIKANAPKIINPEMTVCFIGELKEPYRFLTDSSPLKEGDIFDLPEGLEFKEEKKCVSINCWNCINECHGEKVVRIIKTEVKEEVINSIPSPL